MRALGMVTAVIGGVVGAVVAIVGVRSIPDIKRYLKMRQM